MKKVICINTNSIQIEETYGGFPPTLELHKIYDAVGPISGTEFSDWIIILINGEKHWYMKSKFKPLEEYRQEKINQIL